VKAGPDHGAVFVWMKGLPPAWRLRLHSDSVARVADDVNALFRQLWLETDPTLARDRYVAGADLSERIRELALGGLHARSAADKLSLMVADLVLDFRGAVAAGTIVSDPKLCRLALEEAAKTDDLSLFLSLAELGCDLTQSLAGGGTPADHALASGSMQVARELLSRGVPVPNGIRNAAPFASVELVTELLSRGAEPDFDAVLSAVAYDQLEAGVEIAKALLERDPGALEELCGAAAERAGQDEDAAKRLEDGKMGSNETPAEMRGRAGRYRELARRLG